MFLYQNKEAQKFRQEPIQAKPNALKMDGMQILPE
jgi:hypothetical protein